MSAIAEAARAGGLLLALLIASSGCGAASEAPAETTGTDAGAVLPLGAPEPPAAAASPSLAPCPDAWHERTSAAGVVTCDPWVRTPERCVAPDEAMFPGDEACARVGTACPVSGFPEDLPAGRRVRYVRAGATAGDGSRARPFGSVGEAVRVAVDGDIVAVAAGRYAESLRIGPGVTIWGACTAETLLTAGAAAGSGARTSVVYATVRGAEVRNLAIDTPERFGVIATGTGAIRIEDVIIRGALGSGLLATDGGRIEARSVVVRDTRPRWFPSGAFGSAIQADALATPAGGTLVLDRVLVEGTNGMGIHVEDEGATLELRRSAIREGISAPGLEARGVNVILGATASVTETVIERAAGAGLVAQEGGVLHCDRCVIRETTDGPYSNGRGVHVEAATATLRRTLVEGNLFGGVGVAGTDTSATLEDVVVRGTRGAPARSVGGNGITVTEGGTLTVRRAIVEDNRDFGIMVVGATAAVEDVVVRGTRLLATHVSEREGEIATAPGLGVAGGGRVVARRIVADDNQGGALQVVGSGSRLEAEDVIARAMIDGDPFGGSVLDVGDEASAVVTRALLQDNAGVGVDVRRSAAAEIADIRIERMIPDRVMGTLGRGMQAVRGGRLTVRRAVVDRTYELGVLVQAGATDDGTRGDFEDIEVRHVRARVCAADGRCANPAGSGVIVVSARATLTGFLIDDVDLCGVQLAAAFSPPELVLSRGRIRRAPIGVCVQVADYDMGLLDAEYEDNGTDVVTTSFAVPDPGL